jgi:hypothetical protein
MRENPKHILLPVSTKRNFTKLPTDTICLSGWLGLTSSRASEDAERARLPRYLRNQAERGAAGERSFASLGQNKRPCEKQDKAGPAYIATKIYT